MHTIYQTIWAPLHLADMLKLESSDFEAWKYLSEGKFTVTTNPVAFTSIDLDHAIEHQHKIVKSGKGLSDIKDNESALERFTLTMPIISQIVEEFKRLEDDPFESFIYGLVETVSS